MAKEKKAKLGKREASILLFIIIIACIIFIGAKEEKESPVEKVIETDFSLKNQDGELVSNIDIEKKN